MDGFAGPAVLVGVDGTAGSVRALRWAAEEARQRSARLRVVLAWEPAHLATYSSVASHADRSQQKQSAEAVLVTALEAVFGSRLPHNVIAEVIEGVPARVLVKESGAADLLVLGSAPTASPSGSSVGPVTRVCLKQALCPVMIIGPRQPAATLLTAL